MTTWATITATIFAATTVYTPPGGMAPPAGYTSAQLIFDDMFSSPTLDTSKWNPWLGNDQYGRWGDNGKLPYPYSGPNEPGNYTNYYNDPYPAASSTNLSGSHTVTGSGLRLVATQNTHFSTQGYSWASGTISSYGHFYLPATGGYVQYRAKMPDSTHGAWAALWFMPRGTGSGGAEIDVQESGWYPSGGAPNANYMLASNWHGAGGFQVVQNTGIDLSAGYHVYGIEYNPNNWIKVYLDGDLKASWTNGVGGVVIGNDVYELLIDLEMANCVGCNLDPSGFHTPGDPVNRPGPYEHDVSEVQVYSLH